MERICCTEHIENEDVLRIAEKQLSKIIIILDNSNIKETGMEHQCRRWWYVVEWEGKEQADKNEDAELDLEWFC